MWNAKWTQIGNGELRTGTGTGVAMRCVRMSVNYKTPKHLRLARNESAIRRQGNSLKFQ